VRREEGVVDAPQVVLRWDKGREQTWVELASSLPFCHTELTRLDKPLTPIQRAWGQWGRGEMEEGSA